MTTTTGNTGGNFAALLGELGAIGEVSKAVADADAAMAAGAEDGAGNDTEAGAAGAGEGDGDDVVKSFLITLADGSTQEAVDATDVLKALGDGYVAIKEEVIPALIGVIKSQNETMKGQSTMLKSFGERLGAMEKQGTGRKARLTINDRPNGGATEVLKALGGGAAPPADAAGMSPDEFMSKAMDMNGLGLLSATEISRIEGCFGKQVQPPKELVDRVEKWVATGK